MSFRLFIYYCALCGGWGAFLTWGLVSVIGPKDSEYVQASLIGAILGAFVAAAVGLVDSLLNAVGIQRLGRVLMCAILGLFGGALGGFIGQVLDNKVNMPFMAGSMLIAGWMLAGVLIGAAIGVFDLLRAMITGQEAGASLRKLLNGVYGGLIGGLIGGVPFWLLRGSTALPRSSQLISLVLLGTSIGLMIGLAQVILNDAWLRVEEGFRAGREVMLNQEATTIGRAESCDLGLFADNTIEKEHACIMRENNRFLLEHTAESGQTLLNDRPIGKKAELLRSGDRIQIGKSVLRFGERRRRTN